MMTSVLGMATGAHGQHESEHLRLLLTTMGLVVTLKGVDSLYFNQPSMAEHKHE